MNKKTSIFFWVSILFSALAPVAGAVAGPGFPEGGDIDLAVLADRILNFVWPLFVGFSIFAFILAGFMFLSANGNSAKVDTAKKALLWGIVGVAVGLLAFSVTTIISNVLIVP